MRYNPLLGDEGEEAWKVESMNGNGTMTLQGNPPGETLFPRVTHLLGNHVNYQGEMRKNV
jgi:hypothetical protein